MNSGERLLGLKLKHHSHADRALGNEIERFLCGSQLEMQRVLLNLDGRKPGVRKAAFALSALAESKHGRRRGKRYVQSAVRFDRAHYKREELVLV